MDPRMRKRDKGTEKWFEEIMSESFPKLSGEENRYPSQGSQRKDEPKDIQTTIHYKQTENN